MVEISRLPQPVQIKKIAPQMLTMPLIQWMPKSQLDSLLKCFLKITSLNFKTRSKCHSKERVNKYKIIRCLLARVSNNYSRWKEVKGWIQILNKARASVITIIRWVTQATKCARMNLLQACGPSTRLICVTSPNGMELMSRTARI